jgi:F0F1-type ATP synthase membrane subunit b/b'
MLSVFWPVIHDYIHQNPNHDHAQQWKQWITVDGLNVNTKLQQLKMILQVNTMDQLFIILRDSPTIKTKVDLHWDHKICYRLKHDPLDKNLLPETKHDTPGHTHVTTMNDDEFSIRHKIIYELISEWTLLDIAKSHENWLQWKKWGFAGLKSIQPAEKIQQILEVAHLHEYIDLMIKFPPISHHLDIVLNDDGSVSYHHKSLITVTPTDIANMSMKFDHFTHVYEIKITKINTQLQDVQHAMEHFDDFIKNHIADYKQKLTKFSQSIIESTTKTITQLAANLIHNLETEFGKQKSIIESDLDQMVDEMIQDIHNTTNDAHNTLTEYSEHLLNTFTKEMQNQMQKQPQPVQPTNYIYNTSPSRFGHTY